MKLLFAPAALGCAALSAVLSAGLGLVLLVAMDVGHAPAVRPQPPLVRPVPAPAPTPQPEPCPAPSPTPNKPHRPKPWGPRDDRPVWSKCDYCGGSGSIRVRCAHCGGSGKDSSNPKLHCASCGGSGQVNQQCQRCKGSGRISSPHQAAVVADVVAPDRVYEGRDGSTHDGQAVQVDLPIDQLIRNCGGSDGVGLCVFTSIMFAARLQNVPQLKDFQAWMKHHPGGGWPRKVDEMIARKCKEEGKPVPDYLQIENGDWELVKLALRTGRMPAITYGTAHMVNIVKLENGLGAFRDNNYVGPNEIDWMTEEQARQKAGGAKFWAVVLLAPRPPAPPKNSTNPSCCAAPYQPGAYEWRRFWECRAQWALWRDGEQIGAYDADLDRYGVRNGTDDWGPWYRRPPVKLPPDAMAALGANAPGGVHFIYEGSPRYSRNGAVISRAEAVQALRAATLEDDSKKPSLTVIGSQSEIDRVRMDFLAQPDLATRWLFQGYTPDDWAVNTERFGFAHDGQPTIYLQQPDGAVLCHLRSYDAQSFAALRQKDPNYRPDLDPDPTRPTPSPLPDLTDLGGGWLVPVALLVGVGLVLMLLLGILAALLLVVLI